jgi:hypothetical protein
MPNWCYNLFTVSGSDGDLREFQALTAGHDVAYAGDYVPEEGEPDRGWVPLSFDALVPVPQDVLASGDDGEWQETHWGTYGDLTPATTVIEDEECVSYDFDTPWTPPIAWVAAVAAQYPWLTFTLAYLEPDMALAGLVRCQGGVIREHRKFNDDASISAFGVLHFGFDPYAESDWPAIGGD